MLPNDTAQPRVLVRRLERSVGLLFLIRWFESLQHRIVLGIEGLQLSILGFSGSSQDGICKAYAMRFTVIALVEPASLRDLGTYRNNTEEGDEIVQSSLFCISFHT